MDFEKISQTQGDSSVINDYNSKVDEIVNRINNGSHSNIEKLHKIYEYLVNFCKIELGQASSSNLGLRIARVYLYNGKLIEGTDKYAPVLVGKGVCEGFSRAFKDIAEKCGVETEIIIGIHLGEKHSWIVYLDEERLKHIDIYDGICNKSAHRDIDEYFMLSETELRKKGKHWDYEESAENARLILRRKTNAKRRKRDQGGFEVTSRTDKEENNGGFNVTSRTDKEENKIGFEVTGRTDKEENNGGFNVTSRTDKER